MDGRDLPCPSNYMLLKILPEASYRPIPAALHHHRPLAPAMARHRRSNSGSASRCARAIGLFRRLHIARASRYHHVTRAEAAFVREGVRRHPQTSNPVVTGGNCQAAAGHPAAGRHQHRPDRPYRRQRRAGRAMVRPAWAGPDALQYPACSAEPWTTSELLSDLRRHGDAHLIAEFQAAQSGAHPVPQIYRSLSRHRQGRPDASNSRKWWGGFFVLTRPESAGSVERLFVGNRLAEERANWNGPVDHQAIRAPIIVFASHGDSITRHSGRWS